MKHTLILVALLSALYTAAEAKESIKFASNEEWKSAHKEIKSKYPFYAQCPPELCLVSGWVYKTPESYIVVHMGWTIPVNVYSHDEYANIESTIYTRRADLQQDREDSEQERKQHTQQQLKRMGL